MAALAQATMEDFGSAAATKAALLLVIGEPVSEDHKHLIPEELAKGFRTWDVETTGVDINEEVSKVASNASLGEEGPYVDSFGPLKSGERVMSSCTGTLSIEVLIAPQTTTVKRALKNFLGAPVKYHHLIYAGHALQGTGEWILQDDTFTFGDFAATFKDPDVENALKQQEEAVLNIHCFATGDWNNASLSRVGTKVLQINLNPEDKLSNLGGVMQFSTYLCNFVKTRSLKEMLRSSDVVGNIRFSKPTLYVFPGCQGDSALFGISGFNLLVNGGYNKKACFWDFTRHLDRIDAMLLTHLGIDNIFGMNSVLQRKSIENVHPEIGHVYFNAYKGSRNSQDEVETEGKPNSLIVNLAVEGDKIVDNVRSLGQTPNPCYRPATATTIDPVNLYHKVGHGSLDMYILNPVQDSKELKEFYQQWSKQSIQNSNSPQFPLSNMLSICTLLIWRPADQTENITRIFFPGNAPQHKIIEGLEKLKTLNVLKVPKCCDKELNAPKAPLKKSVPSKTSTASRAPLKSAASKVEAPKRESKVDLKSKALAPKTNKVSKEDTNNKKASKTKEKGDKPKSAVSRSPKTSPPTEVPPFSSPAAVPEPTQVIKESPPDLVQKDNNLLVDFGSAPDQQLQQQQNTAPASDTLLDLIGHSSMKAESEQLLASDPTCFMNNQSPDPLPDPSYVEHDTTRQSEGQLNSGLNPKEMEDMGIYDDDMIVQRERSDDAVEADKLVSSSSDDKGFEEYDDEVQPESLPEPDLIMGSQPLQYDMPTHEFGGKLDSMRMDADVLPTHVNVLQDDYSKEPLAEVESDLNVGQPPMSEVESYSKEEQLMAEVESDLNMGQPPMSEVESDLNVGQPLMAEAESYSKEEQLMEEVESDLNMGQPPMTEVESYSKEEQLMAEVESDLNVGQPAMAEAESYSKEELLMAEVESDLNAGQPAMAEAESYSKEEQLMAEVESDLNMGQPPMSEVESYSKEEQLMAEVESDLNVGQPPMAEAESYSKEEQLMEEVESDLKVEPQSMAEVESYSKVEEEPVAEVESDTKEEPVAEVESDTKEEPVAEVESDTKEEPVAEVESDTKEEEPLTEIESDTKEEEEPLVEESDSSEQPLVEEKPLASEMADPVESMPEESPSPDSFGHDMDKDTYPPADYEHEGDELPEDNVEQDVDNRDFSPNADMTNSVYGNLMERSVPSAEAFEQLQQECAEMENRMHESSSQEDFESQQETKESSPDSERSSPDYEPEEVESPVYEEEESPEPVKQDEFEEDSSKHEDQERSSPEGFDDEYDRDDQSNEEHEQVAAADNKEFDQDENKENNGPDADAQNFDMHHSDSGTAFDEQSDELTEKESADHIKNEDHGIYDEDSEEVASQPEDEPQMDWNESQPEEQMDTQDDQETPIKVDESEADVDSESHTASSLPAAFEKDETPQPGDKLATGCSDQDEERDDTDSIDGGTPEDEKDIDETFGSSQQASDTDKHFDPSTPHPAWSTTSNLSPLARPFDPSGNQAFDPFSQQGANNFSGDKSHDAPGQFQEYESGFGDVQSSGSLDGKAFDPTEEWGRPMNLPSPPPLPPEVKKSNGVATKKPLSKSPSTRTDRKLADAKKPETKKPTSTLGRSPKPALDRKAGLAKTEKPEKKLSNGDADMKSKTRSTASSLDKSKSSHSTAEKKPLTKTRPSSAISAKLETKSANSALKSETKTKLSSAKRPSTTAGSRASPASKAAPPLPPHTTFYVDLTYIPNHGDPTYSDIEFFKRIRARYYVLSALSPNPQILNALLEAKQTWEDKNLEVTVIPTYDNETLRHWMGLHRDELTDLKIDVAPSASRCTIQLQDHETSCSAYRLEF